MLSKGRLTTFIPPFDAVPFLDSTVVWDACQEEFLEQELARRVKEGLKEPFYIDKAITLKRGKRINRMRTAFRGQLALYLDRLEFYNEGDYSEDPVSFSLSEIEGENVLKWNFFEFYKGMDVYRVVFKDPKASGRKYAQAIAILHRIAKGHLPGR